ncbi:MAG: radical SAM protein [Spirochaetales bacterium]|nr:radical SAM protein [Spirochaetales bacterium]
MIKYNEVTIQRILNPTSIDLGEFVINPYKGCVFGCEYCYVRSNRVVQNRKDPWGSWVDIRVNAVQQLKKEIEKKRPRTVLLGSTTEVFQPVERTRRLTGQILELLNAYTVHYVILTRSPVILDYIDILKKGFCDAVYFTVNSFSDRLKKKLEPCSPAFDARFDAVDILLQNSIPVIPYLSPALPWITDCDTVFERLKNAPRLDCECLNFHLSRIGAVFDLIGKEDPELLKKYLRMQAEPEYYAKVWQVFRRRVEDEAAKRNRISHVFVHEYRKFFENQYK